MEIILVLGSLALSVTMGVLALGLPQLAADPGGPGIFPLAMAVMTGGACVLLLGQRLIGRWRQKRVLAGPSDDGVLVFARRNVRQLGVIALVLVFPVAIEWIGFMPAVLVFIFMTMLVSGKRLLDTTLTSLLMSAGLYVAYVMVLGAVLPRGEFIDRFLN
jgi:hypothetical protein